MKTNIVIRGDRLFNVVAWLAWARHYLTPHPEARRAPDIGFVSRQKLAALAERFQIPFRVYCKGGISLWLEIGDAISSTPQLRTVDFNLSALLDRLTKSVSAAEEDLYFGGFVRLLQQVACGELTETDLLDKPAS